VYIVRKCMRSQRESQKRRVHRCAHSNGGTRRLGRVTVGLLRRDAVALYRIIGGAAGYQERQWGSVEESASLRGSSSSYAW
jgi:hypothetical protein